MDGGEWMMMRDGYDLRTIYDDHGVAMGFIWRKRGYAKWGAVLAGHRECCARPEELDADTLRNAAESLYRGESDNPLEAYDRAAAWREEVYGAQRPGVRGGGEEVYPGREPRAEPRGEEAPAGPRPREQ